MTVLTVLTLLTAQVNTVNAVNAVNTVDSAGAPLQKQAHPVGGTVSLRDRIAVRRCYIRAVSPGPWAPGFDIDK